MATHTTDSLFVTPEPEENQVEIDYTQLDETEEPKDVAINGKRALMQALNIDSPQDWKEWLRSRLVKPYWTELWNDYLKYQEVARSRSMGIAEIRNTLMHGERNGLQKYSTPFPDKEGWTAGDHFARFLYQVKTQNVASNKGVFFNRHLPDGLMDRLVWSVKVWLTAKHSPSIIGTRNGGTTIMGTSRDERPAKRARTDSNNDDAETETDAGSANAEISEMISTTVEKWDEEISQPRREMVIKRVSKKPDLNEAFWQYVFVEIALQRLERRPDTNIEALIKSIEEGLLSGEDFVWNPPIAEGTASSSSTQDNNVFSSESYLTSSDRDFEASDIASIHVPRETIILPTKETLQRFKTQQIWFDNRSYQRENHDEACRNLGIANPEIPRIEGLHRSVTFKFWQPVAIWRLVEIQRNENLCGAILGDSVGLGKSWTTIGFLLNEIRVYEEKVEQAIANKTPIPKAKPTLIVVPPNLIHQWASEILRITDKFELVVYYYDYLAHSGSTATHIPCTMDKKHAIFNGARKNARKLVLTSYQTLRHRHGPTAVNKWCEANNVDFAQYAPNCPTDFEYNIRGCFSTIVLDEAHIIRHSTPSLHKTVFWLQADFHLLLTATPFYNNISDFEGYMPFLFKQKVWEKIDWSQFNLPADTNPFELPDGHAAEFACATKEAIKQFIFDESVPQSVIGTRMRRVLSALMVRRTVSSRMPFKNGKMISSDIPPAQRKVIEVNFSTQEQTAYDTLSEGQRRGLFVRSKTDPRRFFWNMGKYRNLVLLAAWLGFSYVGHTLKSTQMKSIVNLLGNKELGPIWKRAIKQKDSTTTEAEKRYFRNNLPESAKLGTDNLELMLWGSPKLRAMLPIIRDQVVVHGEKAIVYCMFPATQVLIAAALKEINIDARVLHGNMFISAQAALVKTFTTMPKECMVLVCSYAVNSAGLNLQNLCRNVHLYDTAMSQSITDHAIGRLCRLGQERIVLIYEYKLKGSFQVDLVMRNKAKALPGLMTDLGEKYVDGNSDVDIGRWVIRDGDLHLLQNGESAVEGDVTDHNEIISALSNFVTHHTG